MISRFSYCRDDASRREPVCVRWISLLAGLLAGLLVVLGSGVARAETPAGARIVNAAELRYAVDGSARSITSNTVTIVVAERLDVRLTRTG